VAEPAALDWSPTAARVADAHLTRFAARLLARHDLRFSDYSRLHAWSVDRSADFWGAFAQFADLRWTRRPRAVLEDGDCMPGARWFPGGELSFADHLLRWDDAHPALIWRNETGARGELTYRELRKRVAQAAAGLSRLGVEAGDRVAAVLPNAPEAVIAMLATTSLGALWSSCSPDFGVAGLRERFAQLGPKVLMGVSGYPYGGQWHDTRPILGALVAALPSKPALIIVGTDSWDELLAQDAPFAALPMPFDAPAFVLYSSGTTGPPKGIVHGAGGTLLQHLKEHLLHVDLHRADRLFWFTTCGWMMWNWLVSGLASGSSIVLYDGSPTHPDPMALWRMAAEEGITLFGTSPRYLAALERAGGRPGEHADLSRLRSVLSTGAPLPPAAFDWVHDQVKRDVQVASISGGTDLISCFALGNPWSAVRRGELQGPGLGMAVDVFDDGGRPIRGARGELVCTRPFPSMPVGFWNDPDGSRFRRAYFEHFPGVWAHGDFAEHTPSGGFLIHGRSDAVLNPGGVRIGTAELYRAVESLPEVLESLAVGQQQGADERIVLFVVLAPGRALDATLIERIRATVRRDLTPRHVPAVILDVPELPRTRNGKLAELAVRAIVNGEPVDNSDALANPQSLDAFRNRV
jgi:acetoacetyl-CoA synthetase